VSSAIDPSSVISVLHRFSIYKRQVPKLRICMGDQCKPLIVNRKILARRLRVLCKTGDGARIQREDREMNWDRIEGNWKQLQGRVKEQWGDLTDDG